jgi:hypothetical protein
MGPCILLDSPPEALDKRDCVLDDSTQSCHLALMRHQLGSLLAYGCWRWRGSRIAAWTPGSAGMLPGARTTARGSV